MSKNLISVLTPEEIKNLGLGIEDKINTGVDEMYCRCGVRLWPDCSVSSASINKEFERHLLVNHLIVVQ